MIKQVYPVVMAILNEMCKEEKERKKGMVLEN